MIINVEVPFTLWLKAHYRAMFAVVSTMGSDNSDIAQSVVFDVIAQHFAHLLAAAFFTFFTRTDVYDFGRCMFFFAHQEPVAKLANEVGPPP